MDIKENVSLAAYSTMRLGGTADFLVEITSEAGLLDALRFSEEHELPYRLIGEGSNLVWSGDYRGLIMVNQIKGVAIEGTTVTIGAGEHWDSVVKATVDAGLSGLEFLSLIPGTAGATPVQNVGAYGVEIKDTLVTVRAYDTKAQTFVDLPNEDCAFGYRVSRFNQGDKGRFLITQITLELSLNPPEPPFYKALAEYLEEHDIDNYSPQSIRDAVIAIRSSKLPDPEQIPNCGSFFKNPVITTDQYQALQGTYPDIPGWEQEGAYKVPAAWLLEQAGLKNYRDDDTGMATYEKHPLVVINTSAKTADDLLKFKEKLVDAVKEKFGIDLVQEPELI